MKLALLSDLHLALPGRGCPFTHEEHAFAEWMDALLATHDQVILLGDIFDHDAGTHLLRPRQALAELHDAWPRIAARLRHPRVLTLTGNHDDLLRERGVPDVLTLQHRGRRLRLLHGHQFARLHRAWERVKYPIKWGAAWEQRVGQGRLGSLLYRINHLAHRTEDPARDRVARGAGDLLSRGGLHIVACGHTHVPCLLHLPGGLYLNTGACAFGRWDWASLDLAKGEVTLQSEVGAVKP